MARHKRNTGTSNTTQAKASAPKTSDDVEIFNFGDPEPVLDSSRIMDHLGVWLTDNGQYYTTPVPLTGLSKLLRANAFHAPLLEFKVNMTMRGFNATKAVARSTMECATTDYMVFANAYFQKVFNYYGEVIELRHLPAINMRRMKEPDRYCMLSQAGELVPFATGEVLHIKNYDVNQTIYGVPQYLGAIQAMLLNEDATLFRRRYYKNGAHMGYIFYSTAAGLEDATKTQIKKAIEGSKGIGNFKNMFVHIGGGKEKDIQILPVGDYSTRDELEKIKNLSRDDIIAAHRVPPAMANIIPQNQAGFGDITKIDAVYEKNEITPIRAKLLDINDTLQPNLRVSFDTVNISVDNSD